MISVGLATDMVTGKQRIFRGKGLKITPRLIDLSEDAMLKP